MGRNKSVLTRKLKSRQYVELCKVYCDAGRNKAEVRRRLGRHYDTINKALNWLKNRKRSYVIKLARSYDCSTLPMLWEELQDKVSSSRVEAHRGHIKILGVRATDWKQQDTRVTRRFVNLDLEAVGGEVVLEPPRLSFPGQPRPDIVLHCEGTPYREINQPALLLQKGETIRVDIVCCEPQVYVGLARSTSTSSEVYCASYYEPSDRVHDAGCLVAHPVSLAYSVLDDKTKPFHLGPGKHPAKVTLPYNGGKISAYLRISSPAVAYDLDAELLRIEQ
jgi:hypothetical protein